MTPESLSGLLEEFLGGSRHASVLEDRARIFDFADSKYSASGEYNKCLLHLWSAERYAVRRILHAELRNGNLRLMVQRVGQNAALEARDLQGPRPSHTHRAPRYPRSLSAASPPRARTPSARLHHRRAQQRDGPRALLRPHLRSRHGPPGALCLRRVRRQSAANPVFHRRRPDLRHPLARCLPPLRRSPRPPGRPQRPGVSGRRVLLRNAGYPFHAPSARRSVTSCPR